MVENHISVLRTYSTLAFLDSERRNLNILAKFGHGSQIWPRLSTTDLVVAAKKSYIKKINS